MGNMIPIDTSRLDYIFRYTLSIMKNIGSYEIKLTCSYVSPVCLCLYNALKQYICILFYLHVSHWLEK